MSDFLLACLVPVALIGGALWGTTWTGLTQRLANIDRLRDELGLDSEDTTEGGGA